jgi:hypothetical protein
MWGLFSRKRADQWPDSNFCTFKLPDGSPFHLSVEKDGRDIYHSAVVAGHAFDATWQLIHDLVRRGDSCSILVPISAPSPSPPHCAEQKCMLSNFWKPMWSTFQERSGKTSFVMWPWLTELSPTQTAPLLSGGTAPGAPWKRTQSARPRESHLTRMLGRKKLNTSMSSRSTLKGPNSMPSMACVGY